MFILNEIFHEFGENMEKTHMVHSDFYIFVSFHPILGRNTLKKCLDLFSINLHQNSEPKIFLDFFSIFPI